MTNTLDIEIRVKNLEAELRKVQADFQKTGNTVEKTLSNAGEKSAQTTMNAFSKLGTFIKTIFAAAIFQQVFQYGMKLIGLGSDLNEETSKLREVFKGMGDVAVQTFTDLAEAQGRARLDMIKYGATIGNIATSFGLAKEQSLELSRSIVQLGTDIASFGNVSDEQGIGALRSALTGEFEPLKNLGYAINETDIKNKAFTLGLAKQGDELTRGQKLLAAYQLILDRTASAQGDAVRTGDGFANQLKRTQGTIKDTLAESGLVISQQTAGSLAKVNTFIQKYGVSIISAMVEVGKSIGSVFVEFGTIVTDVLTAFGVDLGNGASAMEKFGNLTVLVLEKTSIAIRVAGAFLGALVKFALMVARNISTYFTYIPSIVVRSLQVAGDALVGFFSNVSNNIGVLVAKGINMAVTKINGYIASMNKSFGTSIGLISKVGEGTLQLGAKYSSNLADLGALQAGFSQALKDNSDDFSSYINQADAKLKSSIEASNARIKVSNERAGKSAKDDLGKPFADVRDLMKGLGDDSESAGKKGEAGSKKAGEAAKQLKDNIDDIKKSYDKLGDEQDNIQNKIKDIEKAHKKMTDTIQTGLRETTEEIQKLGAEYQKTIAENASDYIRSLAEQEQELKKDIADIDARLATEGGIDLINEKNAKLQEQVRIQEILTGLAKDNQAIVDSERSRAGLSKQDKDFLDFNARNAAEEAKYKAELTRLQKTQAVYQLFDQMQTTSFNQLNKLKTEELTKGLDAEQVALFNKLYNERLEYARLIQDKVLMENDLHAHIIDLSNDVTKIQKDNIASLTTEYKALIETINQAISNARALQSARLGNVPGRVDGGPVSAGQPYYVGENPDGSLNSTSELFVPNVNGQIISANQIRDAIQAASVSNDNSRKIEVGQVITQNVQDFDRAMDRLLFRL